MGQSPKSEFYNSDKEGLPFLQGNRTFGDKYPVFDTWTTFTTKTAQSGDVIMSVRAPVGDVNITPVKMCLGRGVCSLRHKEGEQEFLYYLMRYYSSKLINQENGTVFGSVNRTDIEELEVDIPPLAEQQMIADTLSALDDKIANNRAINHHLELMAQVLFKSWFVDFEPFGGVMPENWRKGTLADICTYSKEGISVSVLTASTYISTENMQPNKAGFVDAPSLPTINQTTAFRKGDILVSNIRPYFKKIVYCYFNGGCSKDVLCFRPNTSTPESFLYCTLYGDLFFEYMGVGSKGTKMPRGDKTQIMQYPIVIPADEVFAAFDKIIQPMLAETVAMKTENVQLAALRDALLPRLMSGELSAASPQGG
jgi:type I restriction enzyme S subunit